MSENVNILWADDEITTLKPQLIFLEKKGYKITTVTNGHDAIEELSGVDNDFDVVFLDESMPGISGLEALEAIKRDHPNLPVIMITKNEAENVMEEALGSQISDYLIKPVNPNQILLALKRVMDNKRLIRDKTLTSYQQEFGKLSMGIVDNNSCQDWVETYKEIVDWELKLDKSDSDSMADILDHQKKEANQAFSKFVIKNYTDWIKGENNPPVFSHEIMSKKAFPHLHKHKTTLLLLLDNLRFDQLKVVEDIFGEYFKKVEEDTFFSILPTATQYSRNAIFSGLLPSEIEKHYPQYWKNDTDEGGKNLYEKELLGAQIDRRIKSPIKWDYFKISSNYQAKTFEDNCMNIIQNDFTVVVYNFIDMLSHARTEMEVLKELASDEKAYRSITRSWLENSPLWSALKRLATQDVHLIVTTDHGTIRVGSPSKVVGDRETTTNLRYKVGRNLKYDNKDVLVIGDPEKAGLPRPNVSSSFIFAKEDKFFLYPNNYNHFNRFYTNTFQHGGISLEEMICPFIRFVSKG